MSGNVSMSNKVTYNKLLRDKNPQVIEASGKTYKTHIATDEKHIRTCFLKSC